MMFTLYLDEDAMSRTVHQSLRAHGASVVTASEAGTDEFDDESQLTCAADHGYVLVTYNMGDYLRVHTRWQQQGRSHTGLILIQQQRYSPGEVLRRLLRVIARKSAADMINHVEFLSAWGER